jgi:hypothetical protein
MEELAMNVRAELERLTLGSDYDNRPAEFEKLFGGVMRLIREALHEQIKQEADNDYEERDLFIDSVTKD